MYEALANAGAASRSCSWTTTSCSSPTRCCAPSRSPASPASRCSSAGRCCRCRPARSSRRWARSSTGTTFLWRNAPQHRAAPRPRRAPLRQTPWLHRRVDVDYNAWWMCLIPRAVAEDVGLPLPLFIKWDDAEYGLRARGARLPHGDGARHRDLAHVVPGEGRHQRLAGLLPLPQPPRRGRDARPGRPEGAAHRHPQAHPPAPDAHGVLGGGAAAHGAARLPRPAGDAVPEPAGGAGPGAGDPCRVRRRAPARLGDRGPAEQPGRARRPGLPGAAHRRSRRS